MKVSLNVEIKSNIIETKNDLTFSLIFSLYKKVPQAHLFSTQHHGKNRIKKNKNNQILQKKKLLLLFLSKIANVERNYNVKDN